MRPRSTDTDENSEADRAALVALENGARGSPRRRASGAIRAQCAASHSYIDDTALQCLQHASHRFGVPDDVRPLRDSAA
jgi:hypothetical protein